MLVAAMTARRRLALALVAVLALVGVESANAAGICGRSGPTTTVDVGRVGCRRIDGLILKRGNERVHIATGQVQNDSLEARLLPLILSGVVR